MENKIKYITLNNPVSPITYVDTANECIEIVNELVLIMKSYKYPEDLEIDICELLDKHNINYKEDIKHESSN